MIPHTILDEDYANDIAHFANTPTQAESKRNSLEQAAGGIGLHVKSDKTKYMCFNQKRDISILNGGILKLLEKFTYLGSVGFVRLRRAISCNSRE